MMRSVGWSGTRFSMTPSAKISNPHTRRAYARPVGPFLAWCEEQGIELRQVTPGLAGRFIEELPGSDPTTALLVFSFLRTAATNVVLPTPCAPVNATLLLTSAAEPDEHVLRHLPRVFEPDPLRVMSQALRIGVDTRKNSLHRDS